MEQNKFSIVLAVHSGERFIRATLDSLKNQTYKNFEVVVIDNNSRDKTREIILKEYPGYKLIWHHENIGVWQAQEIALNKTNGEYYIVLTDVILDPHFLENALSVFNKDAKIGAIQSKVYQMDFINKNEYTKLSTIDTLGFQMFKSRKITNVGHGQEDREEFNIEKEVFAVEGVVPIFRRSAIEDSRIFGKFVDPIYKIKDVGFNYGDDLDVSWRMRILGWKQVTAPNVISWHDRSTTKSAAEEGATYLSYISRVSIRRRIPILKRRLDWSNVRFTILKNDYTINLLRDLPYILLREINVIGYTILFEPGVLKEIPRFIRLLPRILRERREIMKRSINAKEMRRWII